MSEYVYATDEHKGHWLTGEEIVRCRDCKYAMAYAKAAYCAYMNRVVGLDGFCAWSCRKESE